MEHINDKIDELELLLKQQIIESGEELTQTQLNEIERQLNDLYYDSGTKRPIPRSHYINTRNHGLEE